jgi:hypothetical protein
MLRSIQGETIEKKAGVWLERLRERRAEAVHVEELHAGDHWSVVRSLAAANTSSAIRVRVWVCSAGYGLLTWDSWIACYAATFTPGQPDSVACSDWAISAKSANQTWWKLLASWAGPAPGMPRSVTDLVGAFPRSYFLLALSPPYLTALAADLRNAAESLLDRDHLSVLSAGAGTQGELAEHLIPSNARLQPLVGGARTSLNVRLARMALQDAAAKEPRLSVLRA